MHDRSEIHLSVKLKCLIGFRNVAVYLLLPVCLICIFNVENGLKKMYMFESGCSLCPLSVHFKDAWWQSPLSLHNRYPAESLFSLLHKVFLYLTSVDRKKKVFYPLKNLDEL